MIGILKRGKLLSVLLGFCFIAGCNTEDENESIPTDVVYTMGANRYGVIGNGTTDDATHPYQILGLRNIIQLSASSATSMALASNGKVFAWGSNNEGQIGVGDTAKLCTFPREVKGLPEIQKITNGGTISMALDKDGYVWVWGTIYGSDFNPRSIFFSSSSPQKLNIKDVVDIGCGIYHCVAVLSNGDVYSWGRNVAGALGDGSYADRAEPQKIAGIGNIKKVSVGSYHTLALSNDNRLYAWGFDLHGELGNGYNYNNTFVPTPQLVQNIQNAVDIVSGSNHNLCLLSDGTLWGWGENYSGQIGVGQSPSSVYYPVKITGIDNIKSFSAHGSSSIALTNDNKFWAWGNYSYSTVYGGLGGSNVYLPTRIEKLDNAKLIATGSYNYMIVK